MPDDPNYCFVPAYDVEDEVQQIRIVIEGMSGYIPTALVALTVRDAETLCDKMNRKLGLAREDLDRSRGALHARRDPRARRPLQALNPRPWA